MASLNRRQMALVQQEQLWRSKQYRRGKRDYAADSDYLDEDEFPALLEDWDQPIPLDTARTQNRRNDRGKNAQILYTRRKGGKRVGNLGKKVIGVVRENLRDISEEAWNTRA